jgi:protein SPA2
VSRTFCFIFPFCFIYDSFLATSQFSMQAPKLDDQLPMALDGGILDVHLTAFVTAIDNLLVAGRTNVPTKVLGPMKSVVNAVSAIVEDVKVFERRPTRERSDVDLDALRALRERTEATLSNLAAVAKTHATSSGMAPVSLLDAAASHVSSAVTEMGKTVCIRKATKVMESPPPPVASNSYHSNGSGSGVPSRNASSASQRRKEVSSASTSSLGRMATPDNLSSSGDSSPPPVIFDKPMERSVASATVVAIGGVDASGQAENSEDAWAELKVRKKCDDDVFFLPC